MPRSPLRIAAGALAAAALLLAPSAAMARPSTSFTITGAGFGHGVGMSQYGAYGYALHLWDYQGILAHYYTGTDLSQAPAGKIVRVLLQSPHVASFSGASQAGSQALDPTKTYRVAATGSSTVLQDAGGKKLATFAGTLAVTGDGPITLNGTAANGLRGGAYRGWMELTPSGGDVLAVNAIGLEQYVAGVVSAESPASWPLAALEAQAVAARTYAVTTSARPGVFDEYADTRSQMYRGVAAETPSTNQAVNGSRGQIVTYHGTPVATFFFSTSGGRTEDVEDSFLGSSPEPWLKSVDDPYDTTSPHHRWTPVSMTLSRAAAKLAGLVKGRFLGIKVTQRGMSPRIVSADIVGTRGRTTVSGPQLRARFGLLDTWAYFTKLTTSSSKGSTPPPSPGQAGDPSGGAQAGAAARTRWVLAGRVSPGRAGTRMRVQRLVAGRWVAVAATRLRSGGRYRVSVTGAGAYRVVGTTAVGPVVRL